MRYQLVADFPPRREVTPRHRNLVHLMFALLISGLVSFLLARYLATPVRAVRDAARALADGDLGSRVGGAAAQRNDELGQLARDFDPSLVIRFEDFITTDKSFELEKSRALLASKVVSINETRMDAGREPSSWGNLPVGTQQEAPYTGEVEPPAEPEAAPQTEPEEDDPSQREAEDEGEDT